MKRHDPSLRGRRLWVPAAAIALVLPLGGCSSDNSVDDVSDADVSTGTFTDSAVAGLDYAGTQTPASVTDANGQFKYRPGETITFSIGDLVLGSAAGAERMTPLTIAENATDADDTEVNNRLVLLQSIDADGDLNNGIQISGPVRTAISSHAGGIDFGQSSALFRSSLEPVLAALDDSDAFSDTDPRPRAVRASTDAAEHFTRSTSERITVTTTGGDLRGFAANADTWQFLGVPYAKPPLGDLRWRPPVAPAPWDGIREAVAWADQSAQNPTLESVNEGGMSEDSLYLNITAPKNAQALPVMVWFHGGAFSILSANSRQYNNPDSLTTDGVVLVTVNHRLGPFGYIAHPELTAESEYNGSGNYGQMDLVMALEWIQTNIEAFGGDADNVTLFGQSGGGGKTYSLMNSPLATGLFAKAIVMSGFALLDEEGQPDDSLNESEQIGESLFDRVGVDTVEQARALPWTAFVQADLANEIPRQTYRPNVDHYYQTKTYYQNVLDGMPSDVPLMAGVTSGDYPSLRGALPIWLEQRSDNYQSDQYIYKFSRVPNGWAKRGLKSCHGCELPYLFSYPAGLVQNYQLGLVSTPTGEQPEIGDLNGNGISGSEGDAADVYASLEYAEQDVIVSDLMATLWTNFAKTGDPNPSTLYWPPYTLMNDTLAEIGPDTEIVIKTGVDETVAGD